MVVRSLAVLLALCVATTSGRGEPHSFDPHARLSWGTCTTQIQNANFGDATKYDLVYSVTNLTPADTVIGNDITLWVGPGVPDAWRFDLYGCQTSSGLTHLNGPISPECPMLRGAHALEIGETHYQISGGGKLGPDPRTFPRLEIRLAALHDDFVPEAGTTYTLWHLVFDHSYTAGGVDGDPGTCDDGAIGQCNYGTLGVTNGIDESPSVLLTKPSQYKVPILYATASDQFVTWNSQGGCPGAIPTVPTTWGRLKTLYRE